MVETEKDPNVLLFTCRLY